MEDFYGKEDRSSYSPRKEGFFSGQDIFSWGKRERQGFYHIDYLTSGDKEISDKLLKGHIPGIH